MRKIKYVLLFFFVLFLVGCDYIFNTKLKSVTNLKVEEHFDYFQVTFDEVSNADSYSYELYKNNNLINSGDAYNGMILIDLDPGRYEIYVVSTSKNENFKNSDSASYVFVVHNLILDSGDYIDLLTEGDNKEIEGVVTAKTKVSFVLSDETGNILVYKGSNWECDVNIGDVLFVQGSIKKYGGILEFDTNTIYTKLDEEITADDTITKMNDKLNDVNHDSFDIQLVSFTGILTINNSYYNLLINGSDIIVSISNPLDIQKEQLDSLNGKNITVTGYSVGFSGDVYYNIALTSISSNEEQVRENVIYAYFNDEWEDVRVSINDGTLVNMTKVGNHYEIENDLNTGNIVFEEANGNKRTQTFEFEMDRPAFVLMNQKFDGNYSGYFIKKENVNNSVIKLTTLELNDIHGYIEQDERNIGGISNTAYLINQIRRENDLDDVLLIGNGDLFQGTALSNVSRGKTVIEAMNEMQFDLMGIGNHEFDWGIESIFNFFDKNIENGEANFPLINSNIVYLDNQKLVLLDGYNILETTMISKNGLKIGVISCIGDVYDSILKSRVLNYEFKDVSDTAIPLAKALRNSGADIVIVNIHGGSADGVKSYLENVQIANVIYNGKNLVDAVIDGHTHTKQDGTIDRNGTDLYAIQAGSNNYYLGEIELYYDTITKEVVFGHTYEYSVNSCAYNNYDSHVQKIIDDNYEIYKNIINEEYCMAGGSVTNKSVLYDWASDVLRKAVGAQIGIINTGGIRSTGYIESGKMISFKNVLEINPFDNEIFLVDIKGKDLYSFLCNPGTGLSVSMDISRTSLNNSNEIYKVAILDYVYYRGDVFTSYSHTVEFTNIVFRDAMIADLRLRTTFNPSYDKTAVIGNILGE